MTVKTSKVKAIKANAYDDVLRVAVALFSQHGYEGVSMRDIAEAVGLTPAALYYHFRDKEQLYQDSILSCFPPTVERIAAGAGDDPDPWKRMEGLVRAWIVEVSTATEFHRVSQWLFLDADEHRLSKIVPMLFGPLNIVLDKMLAELNPGVSPQLLGMSVIGAIAYRIQTERVRRYLPGYAATNETTEVRVAHIMSFLRYGITGAVAGGQA